MSVVKPIKAQWEAMAEHLPFEDIAFAATYGPVLEIKRAQFLETAHPVWDIVGKWLRNMVDKNIGWLHTLKGLLESGIFFSSDLMKEIIITKLKRAPTWVYAHATRNEARRQWRTVSIIEESPSLCWLLHVRPHIATLQSILLKYFTRERDSNESDYDESVSLVCLVNYMTREEQDAYAMFLCLLLNKLDFCMGVEPEHRNVALEVLCRLKRMSQECATIVLLYTFNEDQQRATGRQRRGIEALCNALTPETLYGLLASVSDKCFRDVFMYETDPSDESEFETCNRLLELLVKASRRVSEATLREMASNYSGWLSYQGGGRDGLEWDMFRQLCELCVEPHIVSQLMDEAGFD